MRSWWFKALALVGGLVAQPSDAWAGGPDETSFRGIEWGSKCSATFPTKSAIFPNGIYKGKVDFYVRADERLTIGTVKIKQITYTCEEDLFVSATVDFDESERNGLVSALTTAWGPSQTTEVYTSSETPPAVGLVWMSTTKTYVKDVLSGTYHEESVVVAVLYPVERKSSFTISNNAIYMRLEKAKGERIRKDL